MSENSSLPELTPLVKNSFINARQRSINDNKTEVSTAYFLSEILAEGQLDSIIKVLVLILKVLLENAKS